MRTRSLLAVAAALCLAVAPSAAQDDTPEGDDANPENLSKEELEAIAQFRKLEGFAIEALRARDLEGAERRYKKLIRKLDEDSSVNKPMKRRLQSYAHYNLACAYSLDEETEAAVAELEKSLELGFYGWKHMKKDTDLDNIRDAEAFKKAIQRGKQLEAKAFAADEERLIAQVTSSLAAKPVVRGYSFAVTTTEGDEVSLESLKGQVVVVSVFIPYQDEGDPPEVPALAKLHRDYKKKAVAVIGLTPFQTGNLGEWLAKFVAENDVKYPLAGVRPSDAALKCYNESHGETRLLFIDKRGKVRGTAARVKSSETLERVVQMLLDAPDPGK